MRPRVGHIQFINCLPLYYGLVKKGVLFDIELTKGTPTELNSMLIQEKLDISPISSIEYARNAEQLMLLPDLTVNADGEVRSILLVSKVPITELDGKTIALTNTSATSHALLKILLKEKYKLQCDFFISPPDISSMLLEAEAALLIGDHALRAFYQPPPGLYTYDLGEAWKELTDLPMVYAVWAIRRSFVREQPELTQEIYQAFRQSMEYSLENIDQVSQSAARWETLSADLLKQYFTCLSFNFDAREQAGLKEFYLRANRNGFLAKIPKLEFIDTQNNQAEI